MVKAGIIVGIVALVLILGSTFLMSPLCSPCWGIVLGLAAGYLAGVYEKPLAQNDMIKKAVIAGVIAALFAGVGSLIGAILNGAYLNPADLQNIYQFLNLPATMPDETTIWVGQIGSACCVGLLNLAVMAGLGAAGGALWWQVRGKNNPEVSIDQ